MIVNQKVNWADIEDLIKILSDNISKLSRHFTSITTISRGGLIPSRLLADSLGIHKILVDQKKISSDSLFVDDIFDTGKTFDDVFSNVDNPSKFMFATLFARRGKIYPKQLIYAKQTNDSSYEVFPWDQFDFQTNQFNADAISENEKLLKSIRKNMIQSKNEYDVYKNKTGDSDLVFNAKNIDE